MKLIYEYIQPVIKEAAMRKQEREHLHDKEEGIAIGDEETLIDYLVKHTDGKFSALQL